MSRGQTGHKPGGVPPKLFMFIGFFFPHRRFFFDQGLFSKLASRGFRCFRVVTGRHWTGSPHKSIYQISKNSPKNVPHCVFSLSGQFSDIFSDICRRSLFLGCPTICPLQFSWFLQILDFIILKGGCFQNYIS